MQKKLIILGGNPETGVLVDVAESMGVYTIVIDPNPNAPAKKMASESYDIDGFDVDNIVRIAKERKVDGVLVGVADILVKPYREICEKLDFPCYATEKAVEAFCSKDGFKRYCEKYNIQDIPGIYLTKGSEIKKPDHISYPLIVKPVDSGGGVGVKICRTEEEYIETVETAFKHSKKGVVLVEKYMDTNCDDLAVYYTFRNGIPYLSATFDRQLTRLQGDSTPIALGTKYPSRFTEQFVQKVHPKLCKMFEGLEIQAGVLCIQFFVENGEFYIYDPGFRLQGEAPHIHLAHINGFDHRKMLINYAFTGVLGEDDFSEKNDYTFKGKSACSVWVLLKEGKIDKIKGLDEMKAHDNIHFVVERFKEGDEVKKEFIGTERQILFRIYTAGDSISEINQTIEDLQNILEITDSHGNDMVLEWVKPWEAKNYSFN
ncbi:carbamoylphosphate synthase [Formosa agariphila KMM 3901]|uniref:Carbamoylphosphate synthase n=1 Tax=Formosa agariphila (strain DSM 15362 / KCTC 12365 / LMG 23005 / KMM 3901 / M-2Alg 35-1) TaxID=1347342 RepID=T2KNJ1_FORAG|nr:carbamoyl-phosphate-synthetase [Formosa agariphila]CDF80006.1 carbamoylphosphate synthase [Formosa agariphila KMM 3901]